MFVLPVRRLKRGLVPDVLDLDLRPPGDSASRLVSVYFLSSVFSNGELELWSLSLFPGQVWTSHV